MNKKFVIVATVFIDVLGMGIVIPTLPFYVQSFGVSAFTVTLLFGIFAFCSFFSAPLLGALSDRIGRRPVILISICSTALGWLVFASAQSIWLLFLGRMIDGAAAGNFSTAQSYLVDIARDEKERTKNLGVIGASFGIALVIGPALGGVLSYVSPTFPFWCVGILATLNLVNAYFNLPESHLNRKSEGRFSLNPFLPIMRTIKDHKIRIGLMIWFLFGLAIAIYQSIFTLYLGKVFNFGAFAAGLFMTGSGIVLSINQGWLLPKFWLKKFKERDLEILMLILFVIGFGLMSTSLLGMLIAGLVCLTFSQSILRVVITSQLVALANDRRGELLGAMMSVMSLAMIVGPLIAGALFVSHEKWPFLISAGLGLVALIILYCNRRRLNKFAAQTVVQNDQTAL